MTNSRFLELIAKRNSGEITLIEQKELSQLLEENPRYAQIADNIKNVSEFSLDYNNNSDTDFEMQWQQIERRINRRATYNISSFNKIAIAASIIGIFFLAGYYLVYNQNDKNRKTVAPQSTFNTKKGSKSTLTLPDGSQVWLNADTKISYDKSFGNGKRELSLTGEAFFDVAHDANHPFIIHTGSADIKVIGTAFNVRNYSNDDFVETSLIRGKIEVTLLDHTDKKIILKPSEKLVIYKNEAHETVNTVTKKNDPPQIMTLTHVTMNDSLVAETMWMQNRMSFVNKPLIEISGELERQYNVNFVFRSDKAKNNYYTAYLNNYSLEKALKVLHTLKKFNYTITANEVIIE